MNKVTTISLAIAAILLLPVAAPAQDDTPGAYVYASYWYCKLGPQYDRRIDELQEVDAQVLEAIQEKGLIQSWGILRHQTGGRWRRLQYHIAPTLQGLWDAQRAMTPEYQSMGPPQYDRTDLCYGHDDYVWAQVTGSGGNGNVEANVSFSTYYVCNAAEEARADEIVREDFAPIMNRLVERGEISGWGWLMHVIGGEYRRLYTMSAASHAAMLAARGKLEDALRGDAAESFNEFNAVCPSHTDYMWDITQSGP